MTVSKVLLFSESPPSVIPVLSQRIPEDEISPGLMAALNARESERAAFMALSDDLVQALRPELERMTTELVQRSFQQAWISRFKSDQDRFLP
jgi:hypothetical protein